MEKLKIEAVKDFYKEIYEKVLNSEYHAFYKDAYISEVIDYIFKLNNNMKTTTEKVLESHTFFGHIDKGRLLAHFTRKGIHIDEFLSNFLMDKNRQISEKREEIDLNKKEFREYVQNVILLYLIEEYVSEKLSKNIVIHNGEIEFKDKT